MSHRFYLRYAEMSTFRKTQIGEIYVRFITPIMPKENITPAELKRLKNLDIEDFVYIIKVYTFRLHPGSSAQSISRGKNGDIYYFDMRAYHSIPYPNLGVVGTVGSIHTLQNEIKAQLSYISDYHKIVGLYLPISTKNIEDKNDYENCYVPYGSTVYTNKGWGRPKVFNEQLEEIELGEHLQQQLDQMYHIPPEYDYISTKEDETNGICGFTITRVAPNNVENNEGIFVENDDKLIMLYDILTNNYNYPVINPYEFNYQISNKFNYPEACTNAVVEKLANFVGTENSFLENRRKIIKETIEEDERRTRESNRLKSKNPMPPPIPITNNPMPPPIPPTSSYTSKNNIKRKNTLTKPTSRAITKNSKKRGGKPRTLKYRRRRIHHGKR